MSARRAALVVAVLLLAGLNPGGLVAQGRLPVAGAGVVDLPGDEWTLRVPRLEVAYLRPWSLPELNRVWVRGRLGFAPSLASCYELSWVGAGPAQLRRFAMGLRWDRPAGFARASLVREEASVRGAGREGQLRCLLGVGARSGPVLVAARREWGAAKDDAHGIVRSEVLLRVDEGRWRAAIARRASPWGEDPSWQLGLGAGGEEAGGFALRSGAAGAHFVLRFARGSRSYRVAVGLDGPQAGAFAFSLGLR